MQVSDPRTAQVIFVTEPVRSVSCSYRCVFGIDKIRAQQQANSCTWFGKPNIQRGDAYLPERDRTGGASDGSSLGGSMKWPGTRVRRCWSRGQCTDNGDPITAAANQLYVHTNACYYYINLRKSYNENVVSDDQRRPIRRLRHGQLRFCRGSRSTRVVSSAGPGSPAVAQLG